MRKSIVPNEPKNTSQTPTMNKSIDADISGFAGFFALISTVSRAASFRVMISVLNTMLFVRHHLGKRADVLPSRSHKKLNYRWIWIYKYVPLKWPELLEKKIANKLQNTHSNAPNYSLLYIISLV